MDLADMIIQVYAAESTLLRTEKLMAQKGADAVKSQLAMARVYLYDAADKVNVAGKQAIAGFAKEEDQTVLLMGLKRFTKSTLVNTHKLRREIAKEILAANKYVY